MRLMYMKMQKYTETRRKINVRKNQELSDPVNKYRRHQDDPHFRNKFASVAREWDIGKLIFV